MSTQPVQPVVNKPSSFYLGCQYDLPTKALLARPDHELHYESKDLCTHGVVVGMTGSGKTGLSLALLEEAALDNVPCIMIDPKGDLTNLLLQFPTLDPAEFARWVQPDEAAQKGLSVAQYAEQMAHKWEEGLHASGYSRERLAELHARSDYRIYTPGSEAGLPLSILNTFAAPQGNLLREDLNQKIDATASALLGLTGVAKDPIQSREHILIANLLAHAWNAGRDLDLPQLIRQIQEPPVRQIGVLDVDVFYKEKDRNKLAIGLNNILAAPSFATWLSGASLDLGQLLDSKGGKTRHLIFSIAHLDDSQRMFFVSLLLSEVLSWTRKQTGTTNLRALLYFDEVYGYLPPYPANPPSKQPLMTLLKQARAFGVGVLLATQNPVDIDYKALSNAGTWFVGKLQTERDKARLLDGLEGAAAERGSAANRAHLDKTISALGNRVFLMHNVHRGGDPKIFQTRWAMSYLRGPMSRDEIKRLMDPFRSGSSGVATPAVAAPAPVSPPQAVATPAAPVTIAPPVTPTPVAPAPMTATAPAPVAHVTPAPPAVPQGLPADVPQFYLAPPTGGTNLVYVGHLLGQAEVVCTDKKMGRQFKQTRTLLAAAPPEGATLDWNQAQPLTATLEARGRADIGCSEAPPALNTLAKIKALEKAFVAFLAGIKVKVPRNPALNMLSEPTEDRATFLSRCHGVAWREFEKKLAEDKETYAGEFTRYGATIPVPGAPDTSLPWDQRWANLATALASLKSSPTTPLEAKKQKQLQELEDEWRSALTNALQNNQRAAEHLDELALTPTAKDVKVLQFGVLWVPLANIR